jgi:ubiquilin
MSEEMAEQESKLNFKIKASGSNVHAVEMAETATVLELKNLLATAEYENQPADRQRLIYSGRLMKDSEPLSTYKIKDGNTVHLVKNAASNVAQNPTTSASGAAPEAHGIPSNIASGTLNNPLAGLTGARYAGRVQLPGAEMFGPDGGVGMRCASRTRLTCCRWVLLLVKKPWPTCSPTHKLRR